MWYQSRVWSYLVCRLIMAICTIHAALYASLQQVYMVNSLYSWTLDLGEEKRIVFLLVKDWPKIVWGWRWWYGHEGHSVSKWWKGVGVSQFVRIPDSISPTPARGLLTTFFDQFLIDMLLVLVFSNCFRAGFGAFSTFKFKVIEGTN